MKLSDFDYTIPKELIAQYPSTKRGEDKLLVLDRAKNTFKEKLFKDIETYFKEGDLLVLNNTKVIPARLFGKRVSGGKVEIFLIDKNKDPKEALVRPSGRIKEGETVTLESGATAKILGQSEIGRLVEFDRPFEDILKESGHVPLPPYIGRQDEPEDRKRYQTVYAKEEGATASPTAGLHFTKEILDNLKKKGVNIAYITLHVSYGTFAPIKSEEIEGHKMHAEFYRISKEDDIMIQNTKKKKGRIFACGTTSLRALESSEEDIALGRKTEGYTNLFIYPGYKFKIADILITNFHLPKSTLLLLASAFAGKELLFKTYEYAIENRFRFFSYGDAMLII